MKKTVVLLLLACVQPTISFAAETNPEIFFTGTDYKVLEVKLLKKMDKVENECSGLASCRDLYAIDYVGQGKSPGLPEVESAVVSKSGNNINLTLNGALTNLDFVRLTLKALKLRSAEKASRKELMLGPSIYLDSDSPNGLVYQGRIRLNEVPKREAVTVSMTATNEDETQSVDSKPRVLSIEHYAHRAVAGPDNLWLIKVAPNFPKGKTITVAVSGIDVDQENKVAFTGKGSGTASGYPKGRDDAEFYLKGQYIFNQAAKDQGSVDVKYEKHIFTPADALDYWYKVEATVGSKSLDISQSGTVAAGRTWWLNVDPNDPAKTPWALSLAPTFQTDRDFKNRDLGADLTLESKPGFLYQPLETKRKEHPDDPNKFGWWIVPKFAIESGWHLASSSNEVDGKSFERGVASVNIMWERAHFLQYFATLRLTVDAAARYLVQDEVLSDSESIVKTDKGYTPYLRAELAYDLGAVAVSVVHENGRLPPNFKRAHATTVGVTVKF